MQRINDIRVDVSQRLLDHVEARSRQKRFYRRGSGRRRFIALDETLVLQEIAPLLRRGEVRSFLRHILGPRDNICCVSAHLLRALSGCTRQRVHRDHAVANRVVNVIFCLDGANVDTLVEGPDGEMVPADCALLMYDAFHPHAGPAGRSSNKLFMAFSDPGIADFDQVAAVNNRSVVKAAYTKVDFG